jgi:hypothetical protein
MKKLLLIFFFLILLGCGSGNDAQNLGNIFDSPGGLVLTQEEHPDGWGRSDCFGCHPVNVIHQENRTGQGELPLTDIRALVEKDGLNACPICHGDNGVTQ